MKDEPLLQILCVNFAPVFQNNNGQGVEKAGYRRHCHQDDVSESQGFPGSVTVNACTVWTQHESVFPPSAPHFTARQRLFLMNDQMTATQLVRYLASGFMEIRPLEGMATPVTT